MINTIEEFWSEFDKHATMASLGGSTILFRGEPQQGNKLIPSLGRDTEPNTCGDLGGTFETGLIKEFKRLSFPVIKNNPVSEFEWLFLAQHYGLPTRLLDWSTNPLVALFFAVEKDEGEDAVLNIVSHMITDDYDAFDYRTADIKPEKKVGALKVFALQPEQGEVIFVRPKYTDQRYLNQRSIFSCPANPFKEINLPGLVKLSINKEWKHNIRKRLRVLGITHSYIYPGLEGVAREVKASTFDPVKNGKAQIVSMFCEIPPLAADPTKTSNVAAAGSVAAAGLP